MRRLALVCAVALAGCDLGGTQTVFPSLVAPGALHDFGVAPVLNERKLEVELYNAGRADLTVHSLRVKEEGTPFWVGEVPGSVVRGGRAVIPLFFEPPEEKDYQATLVLETDDPKAPLLEMSLKGTGSTRAVMELDPASLDFGRTPEGGATVQTFTIRSLGSADLIIEELAFTEGSSAGFTFVGSTRTPFTVPTTGEDGLAGEVKLAVRYQVPPGTTEPAQGAVRVRSTDPDQPEVLIPLAGQVNRAPVPLIVEVPVQAPGMTVTLDGSGSSDPDGDVPLTFAWELVRKPVGVSTDIADKTAAVTSLKLDDLIPGEYVVALHVRDALEVRSLRAAELRIVAAPAQEFLVEMFWENQETDLDLHVLRATNAALDTSDDCSYLNCTPAQQQQTPVDWGEALVEWDNPVLLRDALRGYGPEVTGIESPVGGIYRVAVVFLNQHFAADPKSKATVRVYAYGRVVGEYEKVLEKKGEVWKVADIAWPAGTSTPVGGP